MSAFIAGFIFGSAFIGCAFVLFLTRSRRPRRPEIEPWSEESYQAPVVTTRIIHRKREIEL